MKTRPLVEILEDRNLLDSALGDAVADFGAIAVNTESFNADRILVRWRPGAVANGKVFALPGTAIQRGYDIVNGLYAVQLDPGVSVDDALTAYRANPRVKYAQADHVVTVDMTPNDPSYNTLWGMNNTGQSGGRVDADIDAPEAWDILRGSGNVVVAVIDTGVDYNHPDLSANMWHNTDEVPGNGLDDDHNGYIDDYYGYDFANNDSNPMDDNNHGTHVSGTIGAVGNNSVGVVGVAWNVKIMALKFMTGSGSGYTSDAIEALNYAVANGATISNNSWGGGGYDSAMYDAIRNARNAGHIFVAAAGNSGQNSDNTPGYPAAYNLANIISVAALDRNDARASFSNYGATSVDLGAPGVSIYSTTPNNTYSTFSGTSMASPHVAGVVALVRDQHPEWTYTQVINQILQNTDPVSSLAGKCVTGGRINLFKALGGAPPSDTSGPRVTASTPTGSVTGPVSSVTFTFNETITSSSFTTADVITFTGPGGVNLLPQITSVSGSGASKTVNFTGQITPGAYSMVIGVDITDLANNKMNQDNDSTNGEVPADRYTATFTVTTQNIFNSTDVPKAINDNVQNMSTLVVNRDLTISDINVKFDITHTWDGDLYIHLKSPFGTDVLLVNRRGSSGDNYLNTVMDDESTRAITSGAAPFNLTYRPEVALSFFDGQNARGTWQLWVDDKAAADVGTLNSWSITITSPSRPNRSARPEPSESTSNSDATIVTSLHHGHKNQGAGSVGAETKLGNTPAPAAPQHTKSADVYFATTDLGVGRKRGHHAGVAALLDDHWSELAN